LAGLRVFDKWNVIFFQDKDVNLASIMSP